MIIELRGVEFVNKGAELMLHAIINQIKEEMPDTIFAMEKSGRVPAGKLKAHGIFQKFSLNKLNSDKLGGLVPEGMRKNAGFVLPREVDVVLDASGFAYGDQWGAKKAGTRLANHIGQWKEQGKKVIMLPQAFGPFTEAALAEHMKTIIRHTDLIFARDKISYEYLQQLSSASQNIILKPDFTNLIKGTVPADFDRAACQVAIIPNSKMIETSGKEEGEAYVPLLSRLINVIIELGHKPFFLIHESQSDAAIAEETNRRLNQPLSVIREEDPLHVKGIIGSSKAVVTSRFHGLVSCLSQAIPCLTTGWSHKYEMLLQDYQYPEALVDVHSDDSTLRQKATLILTEPAATLIREKLTEEGTRQKQLSREMWQKVFEVIKA